MCTVSYLPLKKGFILTSNRDEEPARQVRQILRQQSEKKTEIVFPQDPFAGGTWIAMNTEGRTACLLNGAFENFVPNPPYRHSRGKIALNYFDFDDFEVFSNKYLLDKLAPFTLVCIEEKGIFNLIWDGTKKHVISLDARLPHIWSSATLYDKTVRDWRKNLFEEWLKNHPNYTLENIIHFHKFGAEDDHENGFVMNRNDAVKTLSISTIKKNEVGAYFQYHDIENNTKKEICFKQNTHSE